MQRALQLAALGRGNVSPNPLVGCVIVHEGKIIGEGFHQKYGEAHAEVNAVNAVENKELLKESTAYVTLEPCAHHGKTPPCADMLASHRIKKVVIGCEDPFAKVRGKGIEKLKASGAEVEVGVLREACMNLNAAFFTFHQLQRPYVILKWAQTNDGFLARENGDSKWISNQYARQVVHKWRAEEDAILVGKHTAFFDNPSLTTRSWKGSNPVRVLLDSNAEFQTGNLFNEEAPTLIYNTKRDEKKKNLQWLKLPEMSPDLILQSLYAKEVQSIIIEGGAHVLKAFIHANLWDEARVFTADMQFGKGTAAPTIDVTSVSKMQIFNNELTIYQNNHG